MRLLYIWIDDYRGLKNANLNFSSIYRFFYDYSEKKLKYDTFENSLFPISETSHIDDVSVIVGSNGSGKTSIASFFSDCVYAAVSKTKYILIYASDHDKKYYYKTNCKFKIEGKFDLTEDKSFPKFDFIYFSPFYSPSDRSQTFLFGNSKFYSVSTTFLLKDDKEKFYFSSNIPETEAHKIIDFNRCVDYLSNNYKKNMDISLPKELKIYLDSSIEKIIDEKVRADQKLKSIASKLRKRCQQIDQIYEKNTAKKNKRTFLLGVKFVSILEYILTYSSQLNLHGLRIKLDNFEQINESFLEDFMSSIKDFSKEDFLNLQSNIPIKISSIFDFWKCLEKLPESNFSPHTLTLDLAKQFFEIKEIYQKYEFSKITSEYCVFDFYPCPSSGELSEIILFSRINSVIKDIKITPKKDVIIFLDEAEVTLHPRLQQHLVSNLITFLDKSLKFTDIRVHVIFATHSPIILSDIPKSNVILLKKDIKTKKIDIQESEKETFAANIYSLYRNSYFLDETLMGDFARLQINKLVKICEKNKQSKRDLEKINYLASIIGEPILKKIIEESMPNDSN